MADGNVDDVSSPGVEDALIDNSPRAATVEAGQAVVQM